MKQVRKRVLLDGKIRVIILFEFLTKWGTHCNHIVYFTEFPEVNKIIKVFKDDNFYDSFTILITEIKDGLVKVDLL